jgi:flagellar basal-body rod modification protein FlgD
VPVDSIAAASAGGLYATAPTRAPKQEMDGEMFMNLLVTQLKNQDPSSPMDTNQMISQTTSLAMMERLTEISKTGQSVAVLQMQNNATGLLGQTVTYLDGNGKDVSGKATAVSFVGGQPHITVDGVKVALEAISGTSSAL